MNTVQLQPLTLDDAAVFHGLYRPADEDPVDFTNRILAVCERLYTIRLDPEPDVIIGDCALHHWDKAARTIEMGGSLLPAYWGKGYMAAAFSQLEVVAQKDFDVLALIAKTEVSNQNAIRFAEKFGFSRRAATGEDVVLIKHLTAKK